MAYNFQNPYSATIKKRYLLTKPYSLKKVYHIELDISGSNMEFKPGDSLAVFPENDTTVVENVIHKMGARGDELICDRRTNGIVALRSFLLRRANIMRCGTKIASFLAKKGVNIEENASLSQALETGYYLGDPQELCDLLTPNAPRFYSIASSSAISCDQIDITVRLVEFFVGKERRLGLCSNYLCNLAPINQRNISVYVQPGRCFTLPLAKKTPIIMVGPGTGIAPFRAFLQERETETSANKNWLFFGEWNRAEYFYYEKYWTRLEKEGRLRIATAFSREGEHKVYVQHRLMEHGREVYKWLREGAFFYVCGDATKMARDVEGALEQIIATHGRLSREEARDKVRDLRRQKRYLKDVY